MFPSSWPPTAGGCPSGTGTWTWGTTPEKVTGLLAYLAGLQPRPAAVRPWELVRDFSWAKVGAQDRVVDERAWAAL